MEKPEIHCPWNKKMRCYAINKCPLRDEQFSHILDVWVFTGRECPSLNWQRGGPINTKVAEETSLRKCEVTRLFDYPERLQWFIAFGSMTKWLCEDMRRGYFLWGETQAGITLRRAKTIWERKHRRAKSSPGSIFRGQAIPRAGVE